MVRAFAWMLCVMVVCASAACSYQEGACWAPGEDPALGAGGGPVLPPGAGGFGLEEDEPGADPQDADGMVPCANATSWAECTVYWPPGHDVCNGGPTCTTKLRVQAATLPDAEAVCRKQTGVGTEKGAQDCSGCVWVSSVQNDYYCSGTATCSKGGMWIEGCTYSDRKVENVDDAGAAADKLASECTTYRNGQHGGGVVCGRGDLECTL